MNTHTERQRQRKVALQQRHLHEVVDRIPVVVVSDLSVEISQIGSVEDRPILLDELEEEGVLGAFLFTILQRLLFLRRLLRGKSFSGANVIKLFTPVIYECS